MIPCGENYWKLPPIRSGFFEEKTNDLKGQILNINHQYILWIVDQYPFCRQNKHIPGKVSIGFKKNRIHDVWVQFENQQHDQSVLVDVILLEVNEQGISTLLPKPSRKSGYHFYSPDQDLQEWPSKEIKLIKARKRGRPLEWTFLGAAAGITVGVIAAKTTKKDEDPIGGRTNTFKSSNSKDAALYGAMLIGTGIGAIIGSGKTSFEIGGNPEEFVKVTKKLNQYAVKD